MWKVILLAPSALIGMFGLLYFLAVKDALGTPYSPTKDIISQRSSVSPECRRKRIVSVEKTSLLREQAAKSRTELNDYVTAHVPDRGPGVQTYTDATTVRLSNEYIKLVDQIELASADYHCE